MNRTISIITVVLNNRRGFEKTAQSILGQDYDGLEWIVIDGGSTDGTVEAINHFSDRIHYRVSEPDKGPYDAMNKGLGKATGGWVNFMNAGDVFAETTTVSTVMAGDLSGFGVVYGDMLAGYTQGPVLKRSGSPETLDRGMMVCHQSVFIRTELVKMAGFDVSYRIGADYDQLLKLRSENCRFLHLPVPVAFIDITGVSNRKMIRSIREHFTIVQKYRQLNLIEKLSFAGSIVWVSLVSMGYTLLPVRFMHWMARLK